jgi:hypothetical protein
MSVRGVGVPLGIGNSLAGGAVSGLLVVAAVRNLGLSDDSPAIGALFAATAVGALAASWLIGPLQRRAEDDRGVHADDGPRDHESMMDEFEKAGAGSAGAAVLMTAFREAFAGDGEHTGQERRRYYDFIVETTIAGVSAQLPSKE